MLSISSLVYCNSPFLSPPKIQNPRNVLQGMPASLALRTCSTPRAPFAGFSSNRKFVLLVCNSSSDKQSSGDPASSELKTSGNEENWATSVLLFGFWAGLVSYVFMLAPNQTPSRDVYFLQKLLNLKGEDGFRMNEVLVALWYIMGVWPLVYSMLLVPSGRSSKSQILVWPFLVLSCFAGAYALIPYFVLWRPPPPAVEESELRRWPLRILDSKVTAGLVLALGLIITVYASLASGDAWKEFYQYFRESKLVHATSLDFLLFSTFSTFWVFNDMTARKWQKNLAVGH